MSRGSPGRSFEGLRGRRAGRLQRGSRGDPTRGGPRGDPTRGGPRGVGATTRARVDGSGGGVSAWVALAVVALVVLLAPAAAAGETDVVVLMRVAERAERAGDYGFAVQAWKQARDVAPEPAQLFAIARAYRQRHARGGEPRDAARAIEHYEQYLAITPPARHHDQAARHLAELRRLELPVEDEASAAAAEADEMATRLGVISTTLGARARLDGGRWRQLPLFTSLEPGEHVLVIEAEGYARVRRKVTVTRRFVHAVEIALEPLQAKLVVKGPEGATVHVDGEIAGTLPLAEPLELTPGTRWLAVTENGYEPWARAVELERGKDRTVEVELEVTSQRIAAALLMGGGAAGLATGIVLGVLSVVEHRASRDFTQSIGRPLLPDEQAEYAAIIDRRDDYRLVSGVAGGLGLGMFLVGGALFLLDEPDVPRPGRDVAVVPLAGPGLAGVVGAFRF